MAGGIYIKRDGALVPMALAAYEAELELQTLLATHTELLAGEQMAPDGEPRRFVLVDTEVGIPKIAGGGDHWSLDLLLLDQDAVPTLVEVKQSTNPEVRRKVVGQVLDYAANATRHWPEGRLRSLFERRHAEDEGGPGAAIADLLDLGDMEDLDARLEQWWEQADRNVTSGRLRLVFVADALPSELRRIIEYLDEQMSSTEVLGIEVRRYHGEELEALVPHVVGRSEKRATQASTTGSTVAEVWAAAPPAVHEARTRLDRWAAEVGLAVKDLRASRRYAWPAASSGIVLLYPSPQYRSVYLSVRAVSDAAEAEAIRDALARILGHPVAHAEPGLACTRLVTQWTEIEDQVLRPLAAATRPGG